MSRTFLFDFDGTLVDSMPVYVKAMLKILDDFNISYDHQIVKIITPLGTFGTAKYYKTLGVPLTVQQLIKRMEAGMIDEYTNNIPAKEGVITTLKKLKEQGCSLNVLTASPHITLDACLKRIGIFELFDNVWSCDDFSTTKADPEIYVKAAQKIGKDKSEIIFVDDNFNACKTAKQAGMQVYGIYDETSADYIADMKALTDRYVYKFEELI